MASDGFAADQVRISVPCPMILVFLMFHRKISVTCPSGACMSPKLLKVPFLEASAWQQRLDLSSSPSGTRLKRTQRNLSRILRCPRTARWIHAEPPSPHRTPSSKSARLSSASASPGSHHSLRSLSSDSKILFIATASGVHFYFVKRVLQRDPVQLGGNVPGPISSAAWAPRSPAR
jgi:hypothetical protein